MAQVDSVEISNRHDGARQLRGYFVSSMPDLHERSLIVVQPTNTATGAARSPRAAYKARNSPSVANNASSPP